MAFNCRVFGYAGLAQMPKVNPTEYSADSVFQLEQPYLWRETLVADVAAVSSSPDSVSRTMILRVEIPDGEAIRYEINPPNRSGGVVVASTNSPKLSGINNFYFRSGWTISIINASGLD